MLWFRPEHVEVVNWAGDPKKPVKVDETNGEVRLQPRSSFALWKESVTGRCEPWRKDEEEAATTLRQAIVEVILRRAEEIERVNRELSEANIELDSFAYVASHDLKEPLRGVHHLATFLKRGQDGNLDLEGQQQLETILKLTRRMDDLIESLLQYSRTGRMELVLEPSNLDALVEEALIPCRRLLAESGAELRRPVPLGRGAVRSCARARSVHKPDLQRNKVQRQAGALGRDWVGRRSNCRAIMFATTVSGFPIRRGIAFSKYSGAFTERTSSVEAWAQG